MSNKRRKIEQFKVSLKKSGHKVTPQRLMIYDFANSDHSHPTAEQTFHKIRKRFPAERVAKTTVQDTFGLLEKMGMVYPISTLGNARRYECVAEPHNHTVCVSCGRIDDIPPGHFQAIDPSTLGLQNFSPIAAHIAVYGKCGKCNSASIARTTPR